MIMLKQNGEQLIGKMFLLWGKVEEITKPEGSHQGTIRTNNISMFDASKILSGQMQSILNLEGSLSTLLKEKNREKVARKTIKMGFVDNDDFDELMSILEAICLPCCLCSP